jgi:hypothetical protein
MTIRAMRKLIGATHKNKDDQAILSFSIYDDRGSTSGLSNAPSKDFFQCLS